MHAEDEAGCVQCVPFIHLSGVGRGEPEVEWTSVDLIICTEVRPRKCNNAPLWLKPFVEDEWIRACDGPLSSRGLMVGPVGPVSVSGVFMKLKFKINVAIYVFRVVLS